MSKTWDEQDALEGAKNEVRVPNGWGVDFDLTPKIERSDEHGGYWIQCWVFVPDEDK